MIGALPMNAPGAAWEAEASRQARGVHARAARSRIVGLPVRVRPRFERRGAGIRRAPACEASKCGAVGRVRGVTERPLRMRARTGRNFAVSGALAIRRAKTRAFDLR
ncbi:hypothetical protein [Burkholderia savannae]|uniref:hypothetical protein n=1 Tax=Burkholderia savannae TaxID=1637837 RepID=UPI000AF5BC6A|nr:hypothetical protein [Burkholderia savannae]